MPDGNVTRQRAGGHPPLAPMMIGRGSKDRGITRIESQPDDSPQAIEMITKLLREQRDITSATSAAGQPGPQEVRTRAYVTSAAPVPTRLLGYGPPPLTLQLGNGGIQSP